MPRNIRHISSFRQKKSIDYKYSIKAKRLDQPLRNLTYKTSNNRNMADNYTFSHKVRKYILNYLSLPKDFFYILLSKLINPSL